VTQPAGRNPSIRLSPLPAGTGSTLQPFPQIRDGHRINVDADILGKKTRERLQASAFKITVSVFRRSNHQGKTSDEAHRRLADYTVEDFDNLFATNVRSPFFLVQQLLPILGDGSNIIVISSIGSHAVVGKPGVDNPTILAYASTKGALETLVKNWAAILGPQGIRVNAVAPGVIDTDMSNFTKTEAGREATLGMQALKRIGKPEDAADVVAFLASDKARWIPVPVFPSMAGRSCN
jgi:NAD(P)-dependent dehydrogenase (short-subunit alcohol dehydrogenase family)